MTWGRLRTALFARRSARPARHRAGAPGLTSCREYVTVAAALARPAVARRGLFETLFTTTRHGAGAVGAPVWALT
jgi:hypothetical protein